MNSVQQNRSFARRTTAALALAVTSLLSACSGSQTSAAASAPTGPTGPAGTGVVVSVSPGSPRVPVGGAQAFTAQVTGTADLSVTWSVREGAAGGSVDSAGLYRAPGAAGVFHVVATSHADATASQAAQVTVFVPTSTTVTVAPATASVDACATVAFSAAVSGGSGGVTWSVKEGSTGGSVTSTGSYTAPSVAGTYHVVATSVTDPTATAEAAVTVGPEKVLAVAVSPGVATTMAGGTVPFTATVTTSCGTFAAQ